MTTNPMHPNMKSTTSSPPQKPPSSLLVRTLSSPLVFAVFTIIICKLFSWPINWLISGAPIFHFLLLLGSSRGLRVLPSIHLWPILSTLHLIYAISSTSWLLYWVFACLCYPTLFLMSLFQFKIVGEVVRKLVRRFVLLKMIHFVDDKIALFGLPALEIDTDVDGLLVLRGVTFSLSNLSLVVHGVEVGIKLSEDMELAIQTESVIVRLFRGIEISDVFANLKGGEYEMTFGKLDTVESKDADGDAVLVEGTALLKAAMRSSTSIETAKMKDVMTHGAGPKSVKTPKEGLEGVTAISPDLKEAAHMRYLEILDCLDETNSIAVARSDIKAQILSLGSGDKNSLRAAICSALHSQPSVPHPPEKSIKVTTLQSLSSPRQKAFLHRLPMLLRLLLNPLSYFHPVYITSISATASGRWVDSTLASQLFKSYAENNSEIAALQERIRAWLCDANFAVELTGIKGVAHVPFLTGYEIICDIGIEDVMAYRALPAPSEFSPLTMSRAPTNASTHSFSSVKSSHSFSSSRSRRKSEPQIPEAPLKQIIRLGGADARFALPTYLLPHHEHLLPPPPPPSHDPLSTARHQKLSDDLEHADGKPKEVQASHELKKLERDEAAVKISVHARLPVVLDQELLGFVAAVGKASKIVELEKEGEASSASASASDATDTPASDEDDDDDGHGEGEWKSSVKRFKDKLKGGVKRRATSALVNDRWIAKLVGKVTRQLETARGEAGYSGEIPVHLGLYRTRWLETEGEKILP